MFFKLSLLLFVLFKLYSWFKSNQLRKRLHSVLESLADRNPKQILLINGSPRKNRSTATMLEAMITHLKAKSSSVSCRIVHIEDYHLLPCRGCAGCVTKSEDVCPLRRSSEDRFEELIEELKACDAFVITSPVYVGMVSSQIKVFLDRIAPYYHRPILMGKPCIIAIATAAAYGPRVAKQLAEPIYFMGAYPVAHLVTKAIKPLTATSPALMRACEHMLAYTALPHSEWEPHWRACYQYCFSRTLFGEVGFNPPDRAYWAQQGWLTPPCQYYFYPCRVSFAKRCVFGGFRAAFQVSMKIMRAMRMKYNSPKEAPQGE
eukprot:gnl/Trimastix_PCT/2092.p1 GENE.gnl/Trimastix_PCT/2092~~gnl/Trimastix_PCT/2092.p1  ORF type:complete len:317 (+),score=22.52 gnl/Trimastix_PCT/2092:60-1010(+)